MSHMTTSSGSPGGRNLSLSPIELCRTLAVEIKVDKAKQVTILRRIRLTINKLIISHDNTLRKCWDAVIAVVLMYICIVLPFSLAFYDLPPPTIAMIDSVTDYIFWTDIPLNFLTSYENEDGELVADLIHIGKSYIGSGWFFLRFFFYN